MKLIEINEITICSPNALPLRAILFETAKVNYLNELVLIIIEIFKNKQKMLFHCLECPSCCCARVLFPSLDFNSFIKYFFPLLESNAIHFRTEKLPSLIISMHPFHYPRTCTLQFNLNLFTYLLSNLFI